MYYLFLQLWPYLALAMVLGIVIGWFSCGYDDRDDRSTS